MEFKRISASEAKIKLAEVVADAKYHGVITIIQNYRNDSAAIVPLSLLVVTKRVNRPLKKGGSNS